MDMAVLQSNGHKLTRWNVKQLT